MAVQVRIMDAKEGYARLWSEGRFWERERRAARARKHQKGDGRQHAQGDPPECQPARVAKQDRVGVPASFSLGGDRPTASAAGVGRELGAGTTQVRRQIGVFFFTFLALENHGVQ